MGKTEVVTSKLCLNCRHSKGNHCLREFRDPPYTQEYERRYTDSDFCGPNARFFRLRDHDLAFVRAVLGSDRNAEG